MRKLSTKAKNRLKESALHAMETEDWGYDEDNFHDEATPEAVLSLLAEIESLKAKLNAK